MKNRSRTRTTPAFDAVIWDYDGTLVDSRGADEAAVAELLAGDPGAASGAELFWAAEGRPIIERLELAWPGRADEVLPLFESGSLRVPIADTFALEQATAAYQRFETGGKLGKIVLTA